MYVLHCALMKLIKSSVKWTVVHEYWKSLEIFDSACFVEAASDIRFLQNVLYKGDIIFTQGAMTG